MKNGYQNKTKLKKLPKYIPLELVLLAALLSFSFSLKGQSAEVMLINHFPDTQAGISISDTDLNPIVSNSMAKGQDTLWLYLEYDEKFYLQLSNYQWDASKDRDTPFISLYINEIPVLIIHSGIDSGDQSWSFFTGIEKPRLRIVGGTTTSIRDYPWQVIISAGDFICGGSIIADKWVVTAAHCLFDEDNNRIPDENIAFLAGANRPFREDPGGVRYDISYTVVHEDYQPDNFGNDLALLRTSEVIEHEFARPINLITEEEVDQGLTDPGARAIITGWGLTNVDPLRFPDALQKLDLPIVTDQLARVVWGPLPENVLMAGYIDGGGDACSGDSGGPLIVQSGNEYKLAGIISWGSSGCNTIGGYVRISEFLDWLRKNTGIGKGEFRSVRPVGEDFRCENTGLGPSDIQYIADTLQSAISYEWKIEPESAATLTTNENIAEVLWNEDFTGEAYVSARALTAEGYTNWAGQRVLTSPLTRILIQSQDTAVCFNTPLKLDIQAEGTGLTYNWFKDGEPIKNSNEPTLRIPLADEETGAVYYSEVFGKCGSAVSDPIDVNILALTEITFQSPDDDLTLINGNDIEISIEATGNELDYTWFKDEVPIPGIIGDELIIENIDANSIGIYEVQVSGICGSDVSKPVYVFVDPEIADFPEGINIWPTLTRDVVNIAVKGNDLFDIYIYDSKGMRVGSKLSCRQQATINLNRLGPDVYFVHLRFDEETKIYKVVKTN